MPLVMHLVRLDTRHAVVGSTDGMHRLVVTVTWDRVYAVACQLGFGVAHLHGTSETTVLYLSQSAFGLCLCVCASARTEVLVV